MLKNELLNIFEPQRYKYLIKAAIKTCIPKPK